MNVETTPEGWGGGLIGEGGRMACEERQRLQEEWVAQHDRLCQTLDEYERKLAMLERFDRLCVALGEYERKLTALEEFDRLHGGELGVRAACDRAREVLDEHEREHGCLTPS